MRTVLLAIILLVSFSGYAQRECMSHQYAEQQKATDPSYIQRVNAVEQFIRQRSLTNARGNDASGNPNIFRIPVVVHVIYNNGAENISDAQIFSQLDALNKDFRKLNADTANTPERFKPFAADIQIEFALAKADQNGRATTGIIRKYSDTRYWSMDDKIKYSSQGGDDAWDSRSYLNIWIGNTRSLLGYSSEPGCIADRDGVVINYAAFGTINTAAPYNLGRTATHEIGHWFGLKHLWGDAACGDDLVFDTPTQSTYTPGCPSGIRTTCGNAPLGDMYMNYMDFTNDACMNLFSEGQKQRMRSLFAAGGVRNSLLQSKGLNEPWNFTPVEVEKIPVVVAQLLYPNPTSNNIIVTLDESWIGKQLQIVNANGIVVQQLTVTNSLQKITTTHLASGVYFIQGINGEKVMREKMIRL
jgi:hypothetical protein